jgi:oxalate decarboxylase/phosphoglucose isomerase-like protein (cupin superfamily)
MKTPYAERTAEKMKEVLMTPDAKGPAVHYHMIRGGDDKTNITVWEKGKVGDEYIKSYGHYHLGDLEETYRVLQGQGIIILQERATDTDGSPIDDEIKSFRALRVKAGDEVNIPKNTGHLAINTGQTWFVTSDNSPVDFEEKDPVSMPGHADYEPFHKLRGAAYYVIDKDGKPEFIKNPNYKSVPKVILE